MITYGVLQLTQIKLNFTISTSFTFLSYEKRPEFHAPLYNTSRYDKIIIKYITGVDFHKIKMF